MPRRNKALVICSKHEKSGKAFAKLFSGKYKDRFFTRENFVPAQTSKIIVLGGDGEMLDCFRIYHHTKIPIIGFNCGTVGALMNPLESLDPEILLNKPLSYFRSVALVPLHVETVSDIKGKLMTVSSYTFNDVAFKTHEGLCIGSVEGETYPKHHFRGDGIVFCTPSGSTAYNQWVGGSIFPLESDAIGIASIASSYPPIHAVERSQTFHVRFDCRAPVFAALDGKEIQGNVKSAKVSMASPGIKLKLLFLPDHDFEVMRFRIPEPPKD